MGLVNHDWRFFASRDAREITDVLLSGAKSLVEHKVRRALGLPSLLDRSYVDPKEYNDVWEALVPMMQSLTIREKINAENSKQILSLLSKGKINITEAKELMNILKVKSEIEELPKLIDALEKHA